MRKKRLFDDEAKNPRMYKQKTAKGMTWYFWYYLLDADGSFLLDDQGRKQQRHQSTKMRCSTCSQSDAYDKALDWLEAKRGAVSGELSVEQYCAGFYEEGSEYLVHRRERGYKKLGKAWASGKQRHLDHFAKKFKARMLPDVTETEIMDWLVSMPWSSGHKRHVFDSISQMLSFAAYKKIIKANPLKSLNESFAVHHEETKAFTPDEIRALECGHDLKELVRVYGSLYGAALIITDLHSGMRTQEIRALYRFAVKLDQHAIGVYHAVKPGEGIGARGDLKSRGGKATFLLDFFDRKRLYDDFAESLLREWMKESPYDAANDLVFPGRNGQTPIGDKAVSILLKAAIRRINTGPHGEQLNLIDPEGKTPRSLRHTFVTMARRRGLPESLIQFCVGHADEKITNVYDHNDELATLNRLLPM